MCTLMEKDILIEAVASAIALMSKKVIQTNIFDFNEDEKKFIKLRAHIYSTSHEKLNFDEVIAEYHKIKTKYWICL